MLALSNLELPRPSDAVPNPDEASSSPIRPAAFIGFVGCVEFRSRRVRFLRQQHGRRRHQQWLRNCAVEHVCGDDVLGVWRRRNWYLGSRFHLPRDESGRPIQLQVLHIPRLPRPVQCRFHDGLRYGQLRGSDDECQPGYSTRRVAFAQL